MSNEQSLESIAKDLHAREPIFHRPEFGTTRRDFERMVTDDFFEIGASGKAYSRAFVLDMLEKRHQAPVAEDLVMTDFACRHIAQDSYLVTYQLTQNGNRLSRRSTLWQFAAGEWKIRYHQGTLIAPEI